MQIVIDIPEELYNKQLSSDWMGNVVIHDAIVNGTPLPKRHGDLIDVNELSEFASNHDIGSSAFDGELIYNAGETDRGDTIYESVLDKLTVVVKAEKENKE